MIQYDEVKVSRIREGRFGSGLPAFLRHPQTGDIGTIVEVYPDAFEVECSDRSTGVTLWLEVMHRDELELI